jgi:mannonate dehydratase
MPIRLALGQFNELTDEKLRFAAQLGVAGIQMNTPLLPGEGRWEERDLRVLVERTQAGGLRFEAIENVPVQFYDEVMTGGPNRGRQIENYIATIRAMGRAGIPVLGYHFMPNSVWRTEQRAPGRGGAGCTAFDQAVVDAVPDAAGLRRFLPSGLGLKEKMPIRGPGEPVLDEETMWANYSYFIRAVLPAAEEAGVRLALHPDDPPVPMLGGVARLFWRPEGFYRAFEIAGESPAWALDLCLGCCSEMVGGAANVHELIDFFGPRGKLAYIHFRDVQGTVPAFRECFLGEGNFDPAEVMLRLIEVGFDGFLLDDHVPHLDGDTPWCHRGRAHAVGYMQGLLRMAERQAARVAKPAHAT